MRTESSSRDKIASVSMASIEAKRVEGSVYSQLKSQTQLETSEEWVLDVFSHRGVQKVAPTPPSCCYAVHLGEIGARP